MESNKENYRKKKKEYFYLVKKAEEDLIGFVPSSPLTVTTEKS
ncbi:MAG: hypothetical protein ACFFB8_01655 [Promethearchaeota archaeon]